MKPAICLILPALLCCFCGSPSPKKTASTDSVAVTVRTAAAPVRKTVNLVRELTLLTDQIRTDFGEKTLPPSDEIQRRVDSCALALSSRLFMETDGRKITAELNKLIFDDKSVAFDTDMKDLRTLFPHIVLSRKKGSCLGISLLYLCIAEKNDYPVHGVLVPGHFFVRFDDGTLRMNLEPMKKGAAQEDAWYQEKFSIRDSSWYGLANLSKPEALSVVRYNVGNYYLSRSRSETAAGLFRQVVEVLPGFAEAWGNLAVSLDGAGQPDKALEALEKARAIDPWLPRITRNRAALLVKLSRFEEAVAEYGNALKESPADADVHYGLAVANVGMKQPDKAAESARQAIALRPDFQEAKTLLARIGTQGAE